MQVAEKLRTFGENFGVLGVAAIGCRSLFGHPTLLTRRVRGIAHPVSMRIGTTDMPVFADIMMHGQYDFALPFAPGTIVDAGANVGISSAYFASRYPSARVIAVEPEAANFAMLKRNVARYANVVPVRAALWNHDGEIGVSMPDGSRSASGEWAFVTREGASEQTVPALTVPTLMADYSLAEIDILKVDIEGAEVEVFESCEWAGDVRCVMIETHDRFRAGCSEAVDRALAGFSRAQHRETTVYIRPA